MVIPDENLTRVVMTSCSVAMGQVNYIASVGETDRDTEPTVRNLEMMSIATLLHFFHQGCTHYFEIFPGTQEHSQ
jgi:hypothetical protein